MSVFGEFRIPAEGFVFSETFTAEPEMVIEIERVVATDEEYLTPYFWVSGITGESFEAATAEDDSVAEIRKLDEAEDTTLYRAEWQERVEALVYAFTRIGATIMEAKGHAEEWILRLRFDEQDNVQEFATYLREHDVPYDLVRMHEVQNPRTGEEYGLTPKQQEALITAWEMGYYDSPREASTEAVADELDITPQSLSDRLRRAEYTLVGNTLRVTVDTEQATGPSAP